MNVAKNNNPYPSYPTNPFTQKIFTQDELSIIKGLCDDNFIELNPPLKTFLDNSELWMDNFNEGWRNRFIDKLEDED